jgi:hypothetical protein
LRRSPAGPSPRRKIPRSSTDASPLRTAPPSSTRIAALKAGLELDADQEKNWPALESAMRDLAKERAARFEAWKDERGQNRDMSPVDRLAHASEWLSARAADLQKLAAAKPLYDSLDDSQKRRFAILFTMGHNYWRHWRHEREG